jgi:heavy metal translocating P-type ATPase
MLLKKIKSFEYKEASFAAVSLISAVIFYILNKNTIGNAILLITCGLQVIPLAKDMITSLIKGELGIDLLAITAIVTALILGEYITAAVIVLMLTGGESLENYAENRAKGELDALMKRAPKTATLHINGVNKTVPISKVKVGDIVIIKPGDVVPVDAVISEGHSSFDESALTGEPLPVEKNVGDQLLSGSINGGGAIKAKALHSAKDSQYEQIIELVKQATTSQAPFIRMADRYSVVFTLISFGIAGTALYVSGGEWLRFLQVLVVATPCPLLLGAPIALVSGMSRAAKHGIIVKNGSALEKLARVKTFAFDKTGTLTHGAPKLTHVKVVNGFKKDEVLAVAAALEESSNHILAKVIVDQAKNQKVKPVKVSNLHEESGFGLSATYKKQPVLIGKRSLLEKNGIKLTKNVTVNKTASYLAIDGKLAGAFIFEDTIRQETKHTLSILEKLGMKKSLMLTGDNKTTALEIARELGISTVKSDALPADKLAELKNTPENQRLVAMVGDGINDAPTLAAADVGIALGAKGSTAASESADVVIMLDDLSKVAESFKISKDTFKIARQAILIGIFISVGLMLIYSTGKFSPVSGAAIQELIDVIVMIYALRAHGPWRKTENVLANV